MTAPISQSVDTLAARTSTAPFITVIKDRAPTTLDGINNAYMVGQRWLDTSNNNAEWFLLNFASASGSVFAHWVPLLGSAVGDILTLSDDVGTLVTPNVGNIQLVGHINEQGSAKFSTVVAGSHLLNVNPMSSARWIVDPLGFNGTHTTITGALASATAGDTIFLLPGTYTEDLQLKAGVNITAYTCDSYTPNVTILGKCTADSAGSITISNVVLQTNSDFCIDFSGSNFILLRLVNCTIFCTNNTAISFTNSNINSGIGLFSCQGNISTTGISYFSSSALGGISIYSSNLANSGNSLTPSTVSASGIGIFASTIFFPLSTTGTGSMIVTSTLCNVSAINTNCITTAGTGSVILSGSSLESGTASVLSIGAGTSIIASSNSVNSSNTNVFTGAGTIFTGGNVCIDSSGNNVSVSNNLTVL